MSEWAMEIANRKAASMLVDAVVATPPGRKPTHHEPSLSPNHQTSGGKTVPPEVPGVLASDVKPEPVKWLWPNHIPLGKVTMFDGDPDEGKSLMSIDLVARVTKGRRMPDGTECGCEAAGAVIVSLEDGVRDTIRPRLEAAGASLEKVRIVTTIRGLDGIERTPTLPIDLPAIEAAILDVNAKLVVLDPVVGMLSLETNSYRDQDIRRILAPTAQLAEKHEVAIICIRHLNKSGGQNPKYRGGGTIGIVGAARAAFLFADKPGQEGRYIFAPYKGNLWRGKPPSLEYTIKDQDGRPVIAWQGPSSYKAASLLAQPEGAEERNALADAENFLVGLLKDGSKDASDVFKEARRARVCDRTLNRAKATLGILSTKVGMGAGQHWKWRLPNIAKEQPKAANIPDLATFDQIAETKPAGPTPSAKIAKKEYMASFGPEVGSFRGQPEEAENEPADEERIP
jgi:hypothetical protein